MAKVSFFIDGFNLYHAIDKLGKDHLKWLDMHKLAQSFLRDDETVHRIVYFTAYMQWNREKKQRHEQFIKALESVGVECEVSRFSRASKYCEVGNRNCKTYTEKQTDVALAVGMLSSALKDGIDRLVLITADSDQVPTIKSIKQLSPSVSIMVVAPPNREGQSRELRMVADQYKEITPGRLEQCLFPRNIFDKKGNIISISPAKYQISKAK